MGKVTLVVLNAGEASRLRPLTSGTSKAMIRVNGKPVIDHIVESVGVNGIERLVVVEGRIRDCSEYLANRGYAFPCFYVEQPKPTGPMDAIKRAASYVRGPVVVWFGDTLLFDTLPLGETFFATRHVPDQSEWLVWNGHEFSDKPSEAVPDGRAFVGVFGAKSADLLHRAKNAVGDDEFPRFMRTLRALGRGREFAVLDWHDIGVPSRYYATCATLLNRKTRAFNCFHYDPRLGVLTKMTHSHPAHADAQATLEAEALWYESLTPEQAMLAPRFVGWEGETLRLGYEPGVVLSDLALYHDLPASFWDYVMERVAHLAHAYLHNGRPTTRNFNRDFSRHTTEMWSDNVAGRLAKTFLPHDVRQFLIDACKRVEAASSPVGTMHGDMHLSNILYEPTTGRIVFLDPRGRYGSYVGPSGSDMYDYCKLGYDCFHGFSAIVAGVPQPTYLSSALESALARRSGIDVQLVRDGGIVLLASGIPLHYDSERRQEEMTRRVVDYVRGRLDAKAA